MMGGSTGTKYDNIVIVVLHKIIGLASFATFCMSLQGITCKTNTDVNHGYYSKE
jgi:hypothetical protein